MTLSKIPNKLTELNAYEVIGGLALLCGSRCPEDLTSAAQRRHPQIETAGMAPSVVLGKQDQNPLRTQKYLFMGPTSALPNQKLWGPAACFNKPSRGF